MTPSASRFPFFSHTARGSRFKSVFQAIPYSETASIRPPLDKNPAIACALPGLAIHALASKCSLPVSANCLVAMLFGLVGALSVPSARASTIEGINHTHWAINHFGVDGRSGIDVIGPYQGGGGGCCYVAPSKWKPGMTVRVDWETGSAYSDDFPGFIDWPKYLDWKEKVNSQKRQHSKMVPVPDYNGQKACGITVHFLPCDELQVITSCFAYGSPEYPIKTPLHLPEPKSCPK